MPMTADFWLQIAIEVGALMTVYVRLVTKIAVIETKLRYIERRIQLNSGLLDL